MWKDNPNIRAIKEVTENLTVTFYHNLLKYKVISLLSGKLQDKRPQKRP